MAEVSGTTEVSPIDGASPLAGAEGAAELVAPGAQGEGTARAIYGADDRGDLYQFTDRRIQNDADSVVSLFNVDLIGSAGPGKSALSTRPLGEKFDLCPTEPFRTQPVGAFGSGFLVGRDVIATAAHALEEVPLYKIRFVFGFSMLNASAARTTISNSEIYRGTAVLGRALVPGGADWALVRLDRPVWNHRIAAVRRSGKVANGQSVHVIGHPKGLPLKIAGNATVTRNVVTDVFETNFDALKGNSGSPVFNSVTHEVEGIHVRGGFPQELALGPTKDCYVFRVADPPDITSEECTRASAFVALLGPGWQELDDNPATTAIAAGGGALYQLHGSGALWRYTGVPMVGWQLLDRNPTTAELATDGATLYQRQKGNGSIWRYTGTPLVGWEQVGGNQLTTSIVATAGRLYQLQSDGLIWRYAGTPMTGWQLLDSNRRTAALAADGTWLYQLHNDTGAIWRFNAVNGIPMIGWQQVGGNPLTKAILAAGGQLYQLQSDGRIWRYTGTPMVGWELLDDNAKTASLTHDGTHLYQLHVTGAVWRYTGVPMVGWQQIGDDPDTKAITGAGGQLYQRLQRVTPAGTSSSIRRLVP